MWHYLKSFCRNWGGSNLFICSGKRTIRNYTAIFVFCSKDIFIATAKQDKIKIVINSLKTGSDTVSVGTFFIVTAGFLHFELCG